MLLFVCLNMDPLRERVHHPCPMEIADSSRRIRDDDVIVEACQLSPAMEALVDSTNATNHDQVHDPLPVLALSLVNYRSDSCLCLRYSGYHVVLKHLAAAVVSLGPENDPHLAEAGSEHVAPRLQAVPQDQLHLDLFVCVEDPELVQLVPCLHELRHAPGTEPHGLLAPCVEDGSLEL